MLNWVEILDIFFSLLSLTSLYNSIFHPSALTITSFRFKFHFSPSCWVLWCLPFFISLSLFDPRQSFRPFRSRLDSFFFLLPITCAIIIRINFRKRDAIKFLFATQVLDCFFVVGAAVLKVQTNCRIPFYDALSFAKIYGNLWRLGWVYGFILTVWMSGSSNSKRLNLCDFFTAWQKRRTYHIELIFFSWEFSELQTGISLPKGVQTVAIGLVFWPIRIFNE